MQSEILSSLMGKLNKLEPLKGSSRLAAVAVVLSGKTAPKTLLIKRAEKAGDPWSGQIAFPGGKFQETDSSLRNTAVREAKEEVGIDLGTSSEFLGYFRSFRTHTGTLDVIPALFLLSREVTVVANEEVTSFMWVGLKELMSEEFKSTYQVALGGESRIVPAIKVGDYLIWGLTHRVVSSLMAEEDS